MLFLPFVDNFSAGVLFSTVFLAELIVVSSSNAVLKSVNKVSSDSFLQLGFTCFPLLNSTTALIVSICSQALAAGFSASETSVTNSYSVLWEFSTSQKELLLVSSRSISSLISVSESSCSWVLVHALGLL